MFHHGHTCKSSFRVVFQEQTRGPKWVAHNFVVETYIQDAISPFLIKTQRNTISCHDILAAQPHILLGISQRTCHKNHHVVNIVWMKCELNEMLWALCCHFFNLRYYLLFDDLHMSSLSLGQIKDSRCLPQNWRWVNGFGGNWGWSENEKKKMWLCGCCRILEHWGLGAVWWRWSEVLKINKLLDTSSEGLDRQVPWTEVMMGDIGRI